MLQQVKEGDYAQLGAQKFRPLRTNALKEFDGGGKKVLHGRKVRPPSMLLWTRMHHWSRIKLLSANALSVSDDRQRLAQRALSWAALVFITWFAIHFSQERLYADAAYFLTQVVAKGAFHIINGRWLIPLTQWMPLVGVHLGLPVEALISLFSLGNVVLACLAFLFVTRVLKDPDSGTILLATQFVGLTHALFCPIFEFYYGALLLVVFYAVLRTQRLRPASRSILLSVLFVLVISSHFMGLLVMLLLLTLEKVWKDQRLTAWLIILLALQLGQRLFTLSAYESHAFDTVFIRWNLWGLSWLFAPGRLVGHFVHGVLHYPDTLALATVCSIVLILKKKMWELCLLLGGLIAMYVLIGLFFPDGTHDRYREIQDYPPTAWVLMVLGTQVINIQRIRPIIIGLLFLSLVFRALWSTHVAATYTERLAWTQQRMEAARAQGSRRAADLKRKIFIPPGINTAPLAKLGPCEVLLFSACKGPDAVLVLVPVTVEDLRPDLTVWLEFQLAQFGTELPFGSEGYYFHMPKDEFRVMR